MNAVRFLDRIIDAIRQRDSAQFLNNANCFLNILRHFVHSIFACVFAVHFGAVQGVAADIALIVVAVDLGAAASQAASPVMRALGQDYRTGVFLFWQWRWRSVKVTASATVQGVAGRTLSARHHHAA